MAEPTAALLWAACRPQPSADDVRAAVAAGADLTEAAQLAVAQRVSPLLWRALHDAGVTDDSAAMLELEQDAKRCRAQSRLVLPQIGRLALAPLAAAGLETLVVKGGALAHRYPDPGLRPMDDLDMLVQHGDADRVAAVLVEGGWQQRPTPDRRGFQRDLVHPSLPGLHIDLHHELSSWRTRANRLTSTQLWDARMPATLFGAPAFVLRPEHEVVFLASHASKPYHGFDRLIWSVDLAVVIADAEAHGGLDWSRVSELATNARCRTAVAVALTQAARLGAESPPELRTIDAARARVLAPVLGDTWPITQRTGGIRNLLRYALVDERRLRLTLAADELSRRGWWDVPRAAARLVRRTTARYIDRRRARLS